MGQTEIARMFQHVASHGAKLVRNNITKTEKVRFYPFLTDRTKDKLWAPRENVRHAGMLIWHYA